MHYWNLLTFLIRGNWKGRIRTQDQSFISVLCIIIAPSQGFRGTRRTILNIPSFTFCHFKQSVVAELRDADNRLHAARVVFRWAISSTTQVFSSFSNNNDQPIKLILVSVVLLYFQVRWFKIEMKKNEELLIEFTCVVDLSVSCDKRYLWAIHSGSQEMNGTRNSWVISQTSVNCPYIMFCFDQSVKCGHTSKQASKQTDNLFILDSSLRGRETRISPDNQDWKNQARFGLTWILFQRQDLIFKTKFFQSKCTGKESCLKNKKQKHLERPDPRILTRVVVRGRVRR